MFIIKHISLLFPVVEKGGVMPLVPGYVKPNTMKMAKRQAEFAFAKTDESLHKRLNELNEQIRFLKIEQQAVVRAIKNKNSLKRKGALQTVKLYALELENGRWYVGMSFAPEKRFNKHSKGKGAVWTKMHKPIKIHEVRDSGLFDQDDVAQLENDMTIEYAMKYGPDVVRGGGYCQSKPRWPEIVVQNL
jgi:predicted GIY-YIG superfamily endonuclease